MEDRLNHPDFPDHATTREMRLLRTPEEGLLRSRLHMKIGRWCNSWPREASSCKERNGIRLKRSTEASRFASQLLMVSFSISSRLLAPCLRHSKQKKDAREPYSTTKLSNYHSLAKELMSSKPLSQPTSSGKIDRLKIASDE